MVTTPGSLFGPKLPPRVLREALRPRRRIVGKLTPDAEELALSSEAIDKLRARPAVLCEA